MINALRSLYNRFNASLDVEIDDVVGLSETLFITTDYIDNEIIKHQLAIVQKTKALNPWVPITKDLEAGILFCNFGQTMSAALRLIREIDMHLDARKLFLRRFLSHLYVKFEKLAQQKRAKFDESMADNYWIEHVLEVGTEISDQSFRNSELKGPTAQTLTTQLEKLDNMIKEAKSVRAMVDEFYGNHRIVDMREPAYF